MTEQTSTSFLENDLPCDPRLVFLTSRGKALSISRRIFGQVIKTEGRLSGLGVSLGPENRPSRGVIGSLLEEKALDIRPITVDVYELGSKGQVTKVGLLRLIASKGLTGLIYENDVSGAKGLFVCTKVSQAKTLAITNLKGAFATTEGQETAV